MPAMFPSPVGYPQPTGLRLPPGIGYPGGAQSPSGGVQPNSPFVLQGNMQSQPTAVNPNSTVLGRHGMAGSGVSRGGGGPAPINRAPYGLDPNGNPYGNMSHTEVGGMQGGSATNSMWGGGNNPYGGGLTGGPWQGQNPFYSYNNQTGMGGPNQSTPYPWMGW